MKMKIIPLLNKVAFLSIILLISFELGAKPDLSGKVKKTSAEQILNNLSTEDNLLKLKDKKTLVLLMEIRALVAAEIDYNLLDSSDSEVSADSHSYAVSRYCAELTKRQLELKGCLWYNANYDSVGNEDLKIEMLGNINQSAQNTHAAVVKFNSRSLKPRNELSTEETVTSTGAL
jgi:hypothetical protein